MPCFWKGCLCKLTFYINFYQTTYHASKTYKIRIQILLINPTSIIYFKFITVLHSIFLNKTSLLNRKHIYFSFSKHAFLISFIMSKFVNYQGFRNHKHFQTKDLKQNISCADKSIYFSSAASMSCWPDVIWSHPKIVTNQKYVSNERNARIGKEKPHGNVQQMAPKIGMIIFFCALHGGCIFVVHQTKFTIKNFKLTQ